MKNTTLRALLLDSRDGEWGKGEAGAGWVPMRVVRGTDFADVRCGDFSSVPLRYLETRYAERKRLKESDILLETAGGTADRPTGRTVLITERVLDGLGGDATCASFARFLRIDDSKAEPAFVFWLLQYHYTHGNLRQFHLQHTGVARFQFTTFADTFVLQLPSRDQQRRIASILGAYDDLIEVNRRRIALLEEMARRLFEEWFVHFRFPGKGDTPIIETPDGVLPRGWAVRKLGDVCDYLSRGIAPKYDETASTLVVGQKCIRGQRLSLSPSRKQSRSVPSQKLVRPGDVMINSTGVGTLGRVAQAESVPDGLTVDTHVTIVRPHAELDRDFFGLALLRMEPMFEQMGAGATGQTELNRARIANVVLAIPDKNLQSDFGKLARPLRTLSFKLSRHNDILSASRDLLLPRLISGDLSISSAERELETVG